MIMFKHIPLISDLIFQKSSLSRSQTIIKSRDMSILILIKREFIHKLPMFQEKKFIFKFLKMDKDYQFKSIVASLLCVYTHICSIFDIIIRRRGRRRRRRTRRRRRRTTRRSRRRVRCRRRYSAGGRRSCCLSLFALVVSKCH